LKKSLLAIALVCLAAGTSHAQSNVQIYGVVDAGIAYEKNTATTSGTWRMDSGNLNGSRLGFKGTEDLGGGLSAIFQLENGFSLDSGALGQGGRLFGRHAWVGLSSTLGAVKFGRQTTGVYANSDTFDPFWDALAGDSARMFNYSGSRTDNTLSYSYEANGFRGALQYGFGEVAGNNSASRTVAGWGGYKQGPMDVVLTYHNTNNASGSDSTKTTLLGGNYNFGPIQPHAAYAWNKGLSAAAADTRDALLGIRAPVGKSGTFIASWIRKSNKTTANADATQVALGYTYDLSKRTALYTSYSRTTNDAASSVNVTTAGATNKLFNAGIRHKF